MSAHLSWQTACKLGFRGNLDEWERLMGGVARRWSLPVTRCRDRAYDEAANVTETHEHTGEFRKW